MRRWMATGSSAAAGASHYRMSVPGGVDPDRRGDRRRRSAESPPSRRADGADARAARGLPRAWRAVGVPVGIGGTDLSAASGTGSRRSRGEMNLARERTAFAQPFEPRGTRAPRRRRRGARVFPPLYEQVFAQRPGSSRGRRQWWERARLVPSPWAPQTAEALRAARARREAGGLRDLHGQPGLGVRARRPER